MSEQDHGYAWGNEHFCEPDTRHLYNTETERIYDPALGFPVKLDEAPETFCSRCLKWFVGPHPEGSEPRPPQSKGLTHEQDT